MTYHIQQNNRGKRMKPLVAITGASSGIGEATARLFSREGYPLLLMSRRIDRLTAMALPKCICSKVDVINVEEINRAVQEAYERYGEVDCLVNNAGVMMLDLPWNQPLSEWQSMVNVNIMGVLNGIHTVLNKMIERRTGTIINIGSLSGRKTFRRHAVYCATKFAVHALSETIREEVSQFNVRVITIAPGAVNTELITHTSNKEYQEDWWKTVGGVLKPVDIARTILFAYEQPQDVCLREIVITPTAQPD